MRLLLLATTALARKTTREEQQAIASLPTVSGNPLVSLEHINLSSGDKWSQRIDAFYFDVLRCAGDPRSPAEAHSFSLPIKGWSSSLVTKRPSRDSECPCSAATP